MFDDLHFNMESVCEVYRAIFFSFGLFASCHSMSQIKTPVTIVSRNCSPVPKMNIGDTLKVELPANPGTGYIWELMNDSLSLKGVRMLTKLPETKGSENDNAPAPVNFRFVITNKTDQRLKFKYWRYWENKIARTCELNIVVDR